MSTKTSQVLKILISNKWILQTTPSIPSLSQNMFTTLIILVMHLFHPTSQDGPTTQQQNFGDLTTKDIEQQKLLQHSMLICYCCKRQNLYINLCIVYLSVCRSGSPLSGDQPWKVGYQMNAHKPRTVKIMVLSPYNQ